MPKEAIAIAHCKPLAQIQSHTLNKNSSIKGEEQGPTDYDVIYTIPSMAMMLFCGRFSTVRCRSLLTPFICTSLLLFNDN